jgi:hypothetical protein
MNSCRRTREILLALLDEEPLTPSQRKHLDACVHCSKAPSELPAFRQAITRAAESLVAEPLPRGTLTTNATRASVRVDRRVRLGRMGRASTALASSLVVIAVVSALAISSVWLLPGAEPDAPSFAVLDSAARPNLQQAGFACGPAIVGDVGPIVGEMCERSPTGGMSRDSVLFEGNAGAVRRVVVKVEILSLAMGAEPPVETLDGVVGTLGLSEEVVPVLGEMVDAQGIACDCQRNADGLVLHLIGDPSTGYTLTMAQAPEE